MKESSAQRIGRFIRRWSIGVGLLIAVVDTAYFVRHKKSPGSGEMWELGLLVAAEIALVIPALSFVIQ